MTDKLSNLINKRVTIGAGSMSLVIPTGAIIAAALAFAMYTTTLGHGFVLDDNLVITSNVHIQEGLAGIPDLFKYNYAHGHQNYNDGLYRPLSLVSFAIGQSVHDLNPPIMHGMNALLYALLILLLYFWLSELFSDHKTAVFWIVVLFAAHPIHTEVVANVKSRDELFALLFFCGAAWNFTKWIKSGMRLNLISASIWMLFASFSKESAVTFIAIFPLIGYYLSSNTSKVVMGTLVLSIPIGLFLIIRFSVLSQLGEVDSGVSNLLQNSLIEIGGISERFATASSIQSLYIQKLFLPFNLSHDYSYNAIPVITISSLSGIIAILINLVFIALGIWGLIQRKLWSFGILFYYITIAVVANLIILIGAMAAERFLFAPSLGWCIAIVFSMEKISVIKKYHTPLLAAVSIVFVLLTFMRIPDWESNFSLFTTDVERVDQSARAHYNAGTAYNDQAKKTPRKAAEYTQNAEFHLKRAIEIWPEYQDAYNNLGISYMNTKKYDKAYEVYTDFIKRFPEYSKARYNLGMVCYNQQKYDEAEHQLEVFLTNGAQNAGALYYAAEAEGYQGKMQEAIDHLEQLLGLQPNHKSATLKLGLAHGMLGNSEQAGKYLEKAVVLSPEDVEAHFNLAVYYSTVGNRRGMEEQVNECLRINPNHERALNLKQSLTSQELVVP